MTDPRTIAEQGSRITAGLEHAWTAICQRLPECLSSLRNRYLVTQLRWKIRQGSSRLAVHNKYGRMHRAC